MDVIDHLMEEHRKVEGILETLCGSEPGPERRHHLDELISSLSTHMAVEERFVYPIVAEHLDAAQAQEGRTEHDLTREGLENLQRLVDEQGFVAAAEMVTAGIAHHVGEEEDGIFPRLRAEAAEAVDSLGAPEELERQVANGPAGAAARGDQGSSGSG